MRSSGIYTGGLAMLHLWACGAESERSPARMTDPASNERRGVAATDLEISIEALRGRAHVTFEPSDTPGASLRVGGLSIEAVYDAGGPVEYHREGRRLDLALGGGAESRRVTLDYSFSRQTAFEGLLPDGMTFTWPYFCENVFPCHPEPGDGLRFTLALTDTPANTVTVSGASAELDAPSYMLAWATGDYVKLELGRTRDGTELAVWHKPGNVMAASTVQRYLPQVFEYFEATLGAYPFGDAAGAVEVEWGSSGFDGMEHHPYWHVHQSKLADPVVQAHEAAHGWYGNGVRIACWEDLVLSEGVATYLAARALSSVEPGLEVEIWEDYQATLQQAARSQPGNVWPESCGAIDVIADGLAGQLVYMKGAFFLRALEQRIGASAIDTALARFFTERVGTAGRFQDLLDTLEEVGAYDPNACARSWLRQETLPIQASCP